MRKYVLYIVAYLLLICNFELHKRDYFTKGTHKDSNVIWIPFEKDKEFIAPPSRPCKRTLKSQLQYPEKTKPYIHRFVLRTRRKFYYLKIDTINILNVKN